MEFSAPTPPNKLKVKAPASNDSSMSEYCRFAHIVHSMPPLEDFDANFDVGVEQVDGSPYDRQIERLVLYADGSR